MVIMGCDGRGISTFMTEQTAVGKGMDQEAVIETASESANRLAERLASLIRAHSSPVDCQLLDPELLTLEQPVELTFLVPPEPGLEPIEVKVFASDYPGNKIRAGVSRLVVDVTESGFLLVLEPTVAGGWKVSLESEAREIESGKPVIKVPIHPPGLGMASHMGGVAGYNKLFDAIESGELNPVEVSFR